MFSNRSYGIAGLEAPDWDVSNWLNLSTQQPIPQVGDFKEQILYLYFFQSWCPGCHSHGFPTLNEVKAHYAQNRDVNFLAIQTVFEGFESNTLETAALTAERHNLTFPIGHDANLDGRFSQVMQDYRSGGTPWTVLIDKKGVVRFNDFHAEAPQMVEIIDTLLLED